MLRSTRRQYRGDVSGDSEFMTQHTQKWTVRGLKAGLRTLVAAAAPWEAIVMLWGMFVGWKGWDEWSGEECG